MEGLGFRVLPRDFIRQESAFVSKEVTYLSIYSIYGGERGCHVYWDHVEMDLL